MSSAKKMLTLPGQSASAGGDSGDEGPRCDGPERVGAGVRALVVSAFGGEPSQAELFENTHSRLPEESGASGANAAASHGVLIFISEWALYRVLSRPRSDGNEREHA